MEGTRMSDAISPPGIGVSKLLIDQVGIKSAVFISALFGDCFYYPDEFRQMDEIEFFRASASYLPGFMRQEAEVIRFSSDSGRVEYAMSMIGNNSPRAIKKHFSKLVSHGLLALVELTPQQAKSLICSKSPQMGGDRSFSKTCEWCKGQTVILHEHHYPVHKADGGADVVSVCPNCHYEYHSLQRQKFYSATELFLDIMEASNTRYEGTR